jgi:adenylate cyclase
MERKLTAILSADVKGYSRLMGEDEEATIHTLTAYRQIITSLIQQHRGRVVDSPGDNLLAEFASAVDAVQGAVEIQHALKARNTELPSERRMEFRIGVNVGDVIVEEERLYGDGVNIAARLEGLAEPGGICISGTVYDQVETKLALNYDYQGEQTVKNIAKPVRVYRVHWDEEASQKSKGKKQKAKVEGPSSRGRPVHRWIVAGLVLIVGVIAAVRYVPFSSFRNPQSPIRTEEAQLPLPDKPSIVVLPFVNLSKDPEQEYFSDGLTETLTGDLSKISSLFVIARNSAFTYKGKAVKVQDVGREMGVRYVLEGSVLKAGDQVRITAQLIDASSGYHLWTQRYDRPLKDILTLHDEIVQKIVTTLKLQFTLQEQGWIVRKRTDNLEAYDAFLRGMEFFWRLTKETNAQARQMFERAVALDPQYAEAYTRLGFTHYVEWMWRWSADPQTLERAFELSEKAATLDDFLPVAHSLLSMVYAQKRQPDQAIAEGERAIALDPNNADSYTFQAEILNYAGRSAEALTMVEQAMRLNPRYPPGYLFELGWAYRSTGQYTESIATLKEVISRSPNFLGAHFILAGSYLQQWAWQQSLDSQTLEQALTAAQRVMALSDSWSWTRILLGYVYLWQKQYEQAIAELERAIVLDPNDAGGYAVLAGLLSCAGRADETLRAAEKATRLGPPVYAEGYFDNIGFAYYLVERYEEALTPLKKFLALFPNRLDAHLHLAAVYSELGKEAEARAEAAEVLQINPKFSLEVHKQRMPIKDPATLERHIAALRKAGLK